jgi:hypothetical protein
MFTDALTLGSMVLDVNSNRLDARFLRTNGTIADVFSIVKAAPAPLRICRFLRENGSLIIRWKSMTGAQYRVEQNESLDPANWRPISPQLWATGATTSWTNSSPVPENAYIRIVEVSGPGP